MENILDHLTDDPRLDEYIIEVVFEYDYDEALTPKTFIPHSLLRSLILAARPDFPNFFTILDLSLTLKRLILAGVWYDPKNPHMIMWPREYQHALERDISDVGDLHRILLPHLSDIPILEGQPTGVMPENAKFVIKAARAAPRRRKNLWKHIPTPGSCYNRYVVAPKLLHILSPSRNPPIHCYVFSFQNVLSRIEQYIHANRRRLIDPREPNIVDVRNDPLGKVFGVQAFTKIQTGKLILPHLAIVYDNEAWSFFD
jgi:hypothetical protein